MHADVCVESRLTLTLTDVLVNQRGQPSRYFGRLLFDCLVRLGKLSCESPSDRRKKRLLE